MKIGDRVGSLSVRAVLGSGGTSTTYAAWDEKLHREVALKVLDPAHSNREQRLRLLREARILSRFAHPNVCQVFDLVQVDQCDALVLEKIPGRPLDEADFRALPLARRLAIAVSIARALAAAHRLGVVHRDVKLGNVMLADDGGVKVIDFGLARWTSDTIARLPETRDSASDEEPRDKFHTGLGSVVGTAISMSPEQARGEEATAASDIYSFGLLLQEFFTGRSPYADELTWPQLIVKAREGDARPVEGLDSELTDLIVAMRALDPLARPTADQVLARLEHRLDRPRRRRRQALAATAAGVLALLAVGYVFDLRRERSAALAAEHRAQEALMQSERARREAEAVASFQIDLFRGADPILGQGQVRTTRELLDRAAREVEGNGALSPPLAARLLATLARTYRNLGEIAHAEQLVAEAAKRLAPLGAEQSLAQAEVLHVMGSLQREKGEKEAETTLLQALAMRERLLGADDLLVAETLNDLAAHLATEGRVAEAKPLHERVVEIRRRALGAKHPDLAKALANQAGAELFLGDNAAAEALLAEAIEIGLGLGEKSPDLATHRAALAYLRDRQGRHAEAEALHRQALAALSGALGPNHPRVALIEFNLAGSLARLGRAAESERFYLAAIAKRERAFGRSSVMVAMVLAEYARELERWGKLDRALALAREARSIYGRLGREHPDNDALLTRLETPTPRAP